MRLTTLLDTVNNGGSGPWPPGATAPDTLDQLVAELIPCRSNDPELWFAERTAEVERAKALCRTCPLMDGCLAGAIGPASLLTTRPSSRLHRRLPAAGEPGAEVFRYCLEVFPVLSARIRERGL